MVRVARPNPPQAPRAKNSATMTQTRIAANVAAACATRQHDDRMAERHGTAVAGIARDRHAMARCGRMCRPEVAAWA